MLRDFVRFGLELDGLKMRFLGGFYRKFLLVSPWKSQQLWTLIGRKPLEILSKNYVSFKGWVVLYKHLKSPCSIRHANRSILNFAIITIRQAKTNKSKMLNMEYIRFKFWREIDVFEYVLLVVFMTIPFTFKKLQKSFRNLKKKSNRVRRVGFGMLKSLSV